MNYNAYASYPYSAYNPASYASYPQPQVSQQPAPQQTQSGIIWVDGEVGAKAQQLPPGWPANTPLPLWDTNDTIIYLKSTNPMGMPNPLQRLHYTMEEQTGQSGRSYMPTAAPALMSGDHEPIPDGKYVTKEDFDKMKEELKKSITEAMNEKDAHTYTTKGGRTNEPTV